jgi:hypothetical protein
VSIETGIVRPIRDENLVVRGGQEAAREFQGSGWQVLSGDMGQGPGGMEWGRPGDMEEDYAELDELQEAVPVPE